MTPLPGDHFFSLTGSTMSRVSGERPMRIRAVKERDLPELARLDAAAFPSGPYPDFVLRQLFDTCKDQSLVVEGGGTLHGYVLATPPYTALSWILSLGVAPDLRGLGLGRRLMVEILSLLRSEGTHEVWLTVEPGNDWAVLLYRSLGFVPAGPPRKDYFGPGQARLLMTLAM